MSFRKSKKEITLDLTPLVDVIFQLILFFMVSTTFDESSNISIELPQSSSEMLIQEDQNFDIWIDKDGLYYIEEQSYSKEELQGVLEIQAEQNPQTVLHVNADKETSHHHIVFLLDVATELGLQELSVGTKMQR
jgi:biopolymer transport protein ExbD